MNLRLHFQLNAYLGDGRLWELSSPPGGVKSGFFRPQRVLSPPVGRKQCKPPLGEIPE